MSRMKYDATDEDADTDADKDGRDAALVDHELPPDPPPKGMLMPSLFDMVLSTFVNHQSG